MPVEVFFRVLIRITQNEDADDQKHPAVDQNKWKPMKDRVDASDSELVKIGKENVDNFLTFVSALLRILIQQRSDTFDIGWYFLSSHDRVRWDVLQSSAR